MKRRRRWYTVGEKTPFETRKKEEGYMKRMTLAILAMMMILALVGCGKKDEAKKDTYTAKMAADSYGNSAEIQIRLDEDGKISAVDWKEYNNGSIKDEKYGQDLSQEQYDAAQKAIVASKTYPNKLIETQDIDKVDAIAGATQSHDNFVKLYKEAMGIK